MGGLVILALGLWVLLLRPRTPGTIALGTFCAFFGLAFFIQNATLEGATAAIWIAATGIACLAAGIAAFGLAAVQTRTVPRPPARSVRALTLIALALATVLTILQAPAFVTSTSRVAGSLFTAGFSALLVGLSAAILLLARGFDTLDDVSRHQHAQMAIALSLWSGYTNGYGLLLIGADTSPAVLFHLAGGVAWLRHTRQPGHGRQARNVALLIFAMPLIGLVAEATLGVAGGFGILRLITVLVLVHAILRHRLLGMDIKVRWTLSKTTLAGVLVAAFFIVSEGAQQFFGERAENQYLGILAAGALVFAITPLSRLADRIAATAVPTLPGQEGRPLMVAYRHAVHAALRDDGTVTEREETHLAELAQSLGIGAGDALRIRRDVQAQANCRRDA